ncbi:MAG TPA: type II toxin-antitoxin system HicA family toxin [Candidatus Tripitaka californicus]|uniref:type II toxin-antitoxin system HicA family toxin n=1 Tax=Candidatus Tripitaka californicus TaxID=3367616 RepID=UPI0040293D67|nr:type II toxin-antitoxin system HicA family toxin [Planctomycetota bacterium]
MQKLPVLSGREVIKLLKRAGFSPARQRGSHVVLIKQEPQKGKKAVVVPDHKEVDKGTLVEIIRQAGLTREEFLRLYENR